MDMISLLMKSAGVSKEQLEGQVKGFRDTVIHFDNQLKKVLVNQDLILAKLEALNSKE